MKKFNFLTFILVFSLILSLVGCGKSGSTSEATQTTKSQAGGEKELFTLRAVTQTTFSETIIADKLGFFKDEGIEIKYIGTLGQGITQFQAIEQGDIDVFTQGHLTDIARARIAGLTPRAVARVLRMIPIIRSHYLVAKDSNIIQLLILRGKDWNNKPYCMH